MAEIKTYTEEEAHRRFAVNCFNQIWPLLQKTHRTKDEDHAMIHLAHASHYHWLQVGEPINDQRGEWMLARVYTVLEDKAKALHHAKRCHELTQKHDFKDFDLAYANEAMARAHALNGNTKEYRHFKKLAAEAAKKIQKKEDRELFQNDLAGEPWFDLNYAPMPMMQNFCTFNIGVVNK